MKPIPLPDGSTLDPVTLRARLRTWYADEAGDVMEPGRGRVFQRGAMLDRDRDLVLDAMAALPALLDAVEALHCVVEPGTLVSTDDAEALRAAGVPLLPHFANAAEKARGEPSAWRVVEPEDVR